MTALPDGQAAAHRRLRQFVVADLSAIASGAALCAATYLWVTRTPWMLVLAAVIAADGCAVGVAARLATRGAYVRCVTVICVGTWLTAIAVTAIAPVTLPLMAMTALMPVIFAGPYVGGRRLRVFTATSAATVLVLGLLERLRPLAAVPERLPGPVEDVVLVTTLPAMAALILLIVWQNSATLRDSAAAAAESRARLVAATDAERRRLERDLHDGAQQHLVALAVTLKLARRSVPAGQHELRTLLTDMADQVQDTIGELRRLAHGIYPPLLASHGLCQALPAAAARCPVPVEVVVDGARRYPPPVEAAIYFCCLEALQNVAKHAGAGSSAAITVRERDCRLAVTITDTGAGFDTDRTPRGIGLINMADRLAVIGGSLTIRSAPGSGTTVTVTTPAPHG